MKTNRTINIFIVDDDKMFVRSLENEIQEVFKDSKVQITTFETAETCLSKVSKGYPDIVVLDFHLNSKFHDAMNGLQMLKEIKQKSPETDVIMLTGEDNVEIALKTLQLGASDYIVKSSTVFRKVNYALLNSMKLMKLKDDNKILKRQSRFLVLASLTMLLIFIGYQLAQLY